jgi:protein involved in polysaccharide export with SLBB domain
MAFILQRLAIGSLLKFKENDFFLLEFVQLSLRVRSMNNLSKKNLRIALALLAMLSCFNAWAIDQAAIQSMGLSLSTTLSGLLAPKPATTSAAKAANKTTTEIPKTDSQANVQNQNEPTVRSEFQDFVTQSTGYLLPIYGHDLFNTSANASAPERFLPVGNVPVTADYLIGPGDELLISWWGAIEGSAAATVDRNGMINLPQLGQISVVGVRYQNLQAHLKKAFSKNFRNFELDASLGNLRSIQVFVVGQATKPGNYTLSSLSTLVNGLFATGGPSVKGSMRHIQLKRGGKVISDFDMYDLLLKGDKSKDVQLLSGDVIYIPPIGAMAAISGSVNTPAIFELKDDDSLAELINLSGGLTNVASGKKVTVERIHERQVRKVDEFPLDKTGLAKLMRDGDLVNVMAISAEFDNAITLRGNIAGSHAGRKPWKDGLRIKDIIPSRAALITDSYWVRKNQSDKTNDGAWFKNNQIKPSADNVWFKKNQVDTTKINEGIIADQKAKLDKKMSESDADFSDKALIEAQNGEGLNSEEDSIVRQKPNERVPEINWDYATVERLDKKELITKLITFNLGKALQGDADHNIALQPGDIVSIFSKEDIKVPTAKRNNYVILDGEIANPGVYQVQPGEKLRQLIERVGGLTSEAYLFGAEFSRESTRKFQQKRMDDMISQMDAEIQRTMTRRTAAALSQDAANTAGTDAEAQKVMIAKLRKIKATGRIVLEMPAYAEELKNIPELELEDGDRFYVPYKPSTVTVMGTVYNQNAFIYKKGSTVSDYVAKAGGPTRDGDEGEVYLVRADGLVYSKRQGSMFGFGGGFDSRKIMPGDAIVVPEKLERYNLTKELRDWSQIFFQFAIGAASMKTIGVF